MTQAKREGGSIFNTIAKILGAVALGTIGFSIMAFLFVGREYVPVFSLYGFFVTALTAGFSVLLGTIFLPKGKPTWLGYVSAAILTLLSVAMAAVASCYFVPIIGLSLGLVVPSLWAAAMVFAALVE